MNSLPEDDVDWPSLAFSVSTKEPLQRQHKIRCALSPPLKHQISVELGERSGIVYNNYRPVKLRLGALDYGQIKRRNSKRAKVALFQRQAHVWCQNCHQLIRIRNERSAIHREALQAKREKTAFPHVPMFLCEFCLLNPRVSEVQFCDLYYPNRSLPVCQDWINYCTAIQQSLAEYIAGEDWSRRQSKTYDYRELPPPFAIRALEERLPTRDARYSNVAVWLTDLYLPRDARVQALAKTTHGEHSPNEDVLSLIDSYVRMEWLYPRRLDIPILDGVLLCSLEYEGIDSDGSLRRRKLGPRLKTDVNGRLGYNELVFHWYEKIIPSRSMVFRSCDVFSMYDTGKKKERILSFVEWQMRAK